MDQDMIVRVQRSFRDVVPVAEAVGTLFYARLFKRYPELRPLFPADMDAQAKKLVQILAVAVNGLHRLDAIKPAIEDLARRHLAYGVVDAHYPMVGDTLLWTLEQALGAAFTPPVRAAWSEAYRVIGDIMIAQTPSAGEA
jgi:hemoglobin-like flavoprotein